MQQATGTNQVSVIIIRWSQVLDTDGAHIGYVAHTRVGYYPCNLHREMLAGAEDTIAEAEDTVRELHA